METDSPDLEADILACDWMITKIKNSDIYAQNLYAALCNNQFMKNEIWPILKNDLWSCSWRYAGGIIADIRESGDYMDWYCSGIINSKTNNGKTKFVDESVVTDEIRSDLFAIGWVVKPYKDGEY